MSHRSLSVALLCCLALVGCDKTQPVSPSPVAPAAPLAAPAGSWNANMTVVSVSGSQGACQYGGVQVGQTVTGVPWGIVVQGNSISLDENVRNAPMGDDLPYTGSLNGLTFSATFTPAANSLTGGCPLRAATLSGSFNGDFSSFDATEALVFGTSGSEMTVQNHWTGLRQ